MPLLPLTEPATAAESADALGYAARVPLWSAALVQAAAATVVLAFAYFIPADAMTWAMLQGAIAAGLARLRGADAWWLPMHALFVPGLVWALRLELPPAYPLAAFCLLVSLYWGVSRTRVPLFLSSRAALRALIELLPRGHGFKFVDLGCGPGGVLASLARACPAGRYQGIESAPLPYALARLRAMLTGGAYRVSWGNFADFDLGGYDVVYAYLSPAAMGDLWQKARREMRRGSLFVSNSFAVPGVAPTASVSVGRTKLLLWRI